MSENRVDLEEMVLDEESKHQRVEKIITLITDLIVIGQGKINKKELKEEKFWMT